MLVADPRSIELQLSENAALQIDDDPVAGATTVRSLWQNNLVGILVDAGLAFSAAVTKASSFSPTSATEVRDADQTAPDTILDSVIAMIQRTCNPIIQRINAHTERLKAIEEHLEATTSDGVCRDLRTQSLAMRLSALEQRLEVIDSQKAAAPVVSGSLPMQMRFFKPEAQPLKLTTMPLLKPLNPAT